MHEGQQKSPGGVGVVQGAVLLGKGNAEVSHQPAEAVAALLGQKDTSQFEGIQVGVVEVHPLLPQEAEVEVHVVSDNDRA